MTASSGDESALVARQQRADYDMDRAIRTLSFAFDQTGMSTEPVVFHSIQVALLLRELGYSRDVQIAGVFHDLLRVSHYPLHDIAHDFGDDVAFLAAVNTPDMSIEDDSVRFEQLLARCLTVGSEAAAILGASLCEQASVADEAWRQKAQSFLEQSAETMADDAVWMRLEQLARSRAGD